MGLYLLYGQNVRKSVLTHYTAVHKSRENLTRRQKDTLCVQNRASVLSVTEIYESKGGRLESAMRSPLPEISFCVFALFPRDVRVMDLKRWKFTRISDAFLFESLAVFAFLRRDLSARNIAFSRSICFRVYAKDHKMLVGAHFSCGSLKELKIRRNYVDKVPC